MLHEWLRLAVDAFGIVALLVFGVTVAALVTARRAMDARLHEERCPELRPAGSERCELDAEHEGPCLVREQGAWGTTDRWWVPRKPLTPGGRRY